MKRRKGQQWTGMLLACSLTIGAMPIQVQASEMPYAVMSTEAIQKMNAEAVASKKEIKKVELDLYKDDKKTTLEDVLKGLTDEMTPQSLDIKIKKSNESDPYKIVDYYWAITKGDELRNGNFKPFANYEIRVVVAADDGAFFSQIGVGGVSGKLGDVADQGITLEGPGKLLIKFSSDEVEGKKPIVKKVVKKIELMADGPRIGQKVKDVTIKGLDENAFVSKIEWGVISPRGGDTLDKESEFADGEKYGLGIILEPKANVIVKGDLQATLNGESMEVSKENNKVTLTKEFSPLAIHEIKKITLDKMQYEFTKKGEKQQAKVTTEPSRTSPKDLVWEVKDQKIATVDSNGNITPVSEGETELIVKNLKGNVEAKATIKVAWDLMITLDLQGGKLENQESILSQKKGMAIGKLPTPTKDGFEFLGWYTMADGKGEKVEETKVFDQDSTIFAAWKSKDKNDNGGGNNGGGNNGGGNNGGGNNGGGNNGGGNNGGGNNGGGNNGGGNNGGGNNGGGNNGGGNNGGGNNGGGNNQGNVNNNRSGGGSSSRSPVRPDSSREQRIEDSKVPQAQAPELVNIDHLKDVKKSDWFYLDVQKAVTKRIMSGVSSSRFAPHQTTNRAMVVSMLYNMAGHPPVQKNSYKDVKANAYYVNSATWAKENNILQGISEDRFGPNQTISREWMAVALYQYVKMSKSEMKKGDISHFEDAAMVSEQAKEAMQWAFAEGIITGKGSKLDPKGATTRAEVAAIFVRFAEKMGK